MLIMRLLYALLLMLSSTATAYSVVQFMADYENVLLTITRTSTPDPFITSAHGKYYLVSNIIIVTIHRSNSDSHSLPETEWNYGPQTA